MFFYTCTLSIILNVPTKVAKMIFISCLTHHFQPEYFIVFEVLLNGYMSATHNKAHHNVSWDLVHQQSN